MRRRSIQQDAGRLIAVLTLALLMGCTQESLFSSLSRASRESSQSELTGTPVTPGTAAGGKVVLTESGVLEGPTVACGTEGICFGKVQF